MKVGFTQILEFDKIFPEENYLDYLQKVDFIPKAFFIDFSTHFLSFHITNPLISDINSLISMWFNSGNKKFANHVYEKYQAFQRTQNIDISIINPRSSLELFRKIIVCNTNKSFLSENEIEILLFKIYLAINQECTERELKFKKNIERLPKSDQFISLVLNQSIATFDYSNFNIKQIYITQSLKSIMLFQLLESKPEYHNLLFSFCEKYKVSNYKEYLRDLMPLASMVLESTESGNIDINISNSPNSEKAKYFLDKFALSEAKEEDQSDYELLRNYPILKIGENTYRIIYPLFVLERLFKGLYFDLKEINNELDDDHKVKNLRGVFTLNFAEKELLYSLMKNSFGNKHLQFKGSDFESNKVNGGLDYYLRNKQNVFLFESKDILISSQAKSSYDFEILQNELSKKLYNDVKEYGKQKPKAVRQIFTFIKTLLDKKLVLDQNYDPNSINIYPILILHDRQLDVLGLNVLINKWFNIEKNKLEKGAYNFKNVRDIVIIQIDTLIIYQEKIFSGEIKLDKPVVHL